MPKALKIRPSWLLLIPNCSCNDLAATLKFRRSRKFNATARVRKKQIRQRMREARSAGLGNSDGDIGTTQEIISQACSQTRLAGKLRKAAVDANVVGVDLAVPPLIEAAHSFQDHGIRAGGAKMKIGKNGDEARTIVRRKGQVERVGEDGDFLRLRDSA